MTIYAFNVEKEDVWNGDVAIKLTYRDLGIETTYHIPFEWAEYFYGVFTKAMKEARPLHKAHKKKSEEEYKQYLKNLPKESPENGFIDDDDPYDW